MNRFAQKKFRLVTVTVVLVSFFAIQGSVLAAAPTVGGIVTSTAKFGACTLSGKISPYLASLINDGYKHLNKLLGNILSKIPGLSKVLGPAGGIVGGTVPVTDESLITIQKSLRGKETGSDVVTRCAAMEILNYLNKNINDIARNSGRDGGVTWVKNWRNFQLNSQYRGERVFRNMLASTKPCDYFGNDLKNIFGAKQTKPLPGIKTRAGDFDSFALKLGCTLPKDFKIENYKKDFSGNGGWEAWSRILEPQNNFYGALFQSLDEANKQRAVEEAADVNQALADRGFTGKSGDNKADSCLQTDDAGECIAYKDIKTPGSVIADSVAASIKTELDVAISADEINELISTATQVLVNRLKDLSNANEGDYISPELNSIGVNPLPNQCNAIFVDEGASARYGSDVQTAINEFLAANPDVANTPSSDEVLGPFLEGVAAILSSKGFVSGRAINCNGNLGSDAIIVGKAGDAYGDYFDLRNGTIEGQGGTIAEAAQVLFVEWAGMERLVGVSGGGGGNGGGGGSGEGEGDSGNPPSF